MHPVIFFLSERRPKAGYGSVTSGAMSRRKHLATAKVELVDWCTIDKVEQAPSM